MRFIFYSLIFLFFSFSCLSQEKDVEQLFNEMSKKHKNLNEAIRVDVSSLSVYELLNSIATEHKINISADSDLRATVESSFFDIPIKDVFVFIAKKYDLKVEVINNIIVFKKIIPELKKQETEKEVKKEIEASFNKENRFLSIKVRNHPVEEVTQKITDISGVNIVLSSKVREKKISSYILNRPIDQVIEMMAMSNQMSLTIDKNGFYYLDESSSNHKKRNHKKNDSEEGFTGLNKLMSKAKIKIDSKGFISIKAFDADIMAIIAKVANELKVNYFMYDKVEGLKTTLVADSISFEELLDNIFKGKNYTFKKEDDFYFIGKQNTEGLRVTELIQLENRTIETVLKTLPKDLMEGVEVKEFIELNGFIASGSRRRIQEVKGYIKKIDKIVPMILIEVLIVQYKKSSEVQTGLSVLFDNKKEHINAGKLYPNAGVTFNSTTINKLISAFNGFGIFNLGKVTKNFYANLSALENNSIIRLQSTPKISTLNGHEAKLSIGETNYYFEQKNRLINNPGGGSNVFQSGQWKSTEANLSVLIKPFVSKDEQITLSINVERSNFLARQGKDSPPGKATQQFESLIRCKNGEMILMGGLNELERENSGTGTPWVSRIPILKWIFSSRKKKKSKSKLHIFIKPKVVY